MQSLKLNVLKLARNIDEMKLKLVSSLIYSYFHIFMGFITYTYHEIILVYSTQVEDKEALDNKAGEQVKSHMLSRLHLSIFMFPLVMILSVATSFKVGHAWFEGNALRG